MSGEIAWNTLVDQYFDQVYFKFSPTSGTSAGLHQYDTQLEDYSRAGVDRNIAALHDFEKRVESFDGKSLSETEAADRDACFPIFTELFSHWKRFVPGLRLRLTVKTHSDGSKQNDGN